MTQLDEQQVLDRLLDRLEALRPDSWELTSDEQGALKTSRDYLAHLGSKDEMMRAILSCGAYGEMSIEEFSGLTIYSLHVNVGVRNLMSHTEENPRDDSRLVQLYSHVNDYWEPRIPEVQDQRRQGRLAKLTDMLDGGSDT